MDVLGGGGASEDLPRLPLPAWSEAACLPHVELRRRKAAVFRAGAWVVRDTDGTILVWDEDAAQWAFALGPGRCLETGDEHVRAPFPHECRETGEWRRTWETAHYAVGRLDPGETRMERYLKALRGSEGAASRAGHSDGARPSTSAGDGRWD